MVPGASSPFRTWRLTHGHPGRPSGRRWNPFLGKARSAKVEELLEPVQTTRYDGDANLIWAPNPDGKTWDVIPIFFPDYGGPVALPIIDLGSGEVKVHQAKNKGWHLAPYALAPNGKVYISTVRGPVRIVVYDPATNGFDEGAVTIPEHVIGETHPITLSTDGMIFAGGGHPTQAASLVMIDPETHEVTDFGPCGPSHRPTRCYNYDVAADDTHVYIASGKVPWYLLAVDRATRKTTVLAKTAPSGGLIRVYQTTHGAKAYVREGGGKKPQNFWCYQGKLVPQSQPEPWPKTGIDLGKNFPPKPEVFSLAAVPGPSQPGELWFKTDTPNAIRDPGSPGWSGFRYEVPLYSMTSDRLIEMPDGRIFGTAGSYCGHYIYDPASRRVHLHRQHQAQPLRHRRP